MKKWYSYILLVLFSAFLVAVAVNFGGYVKMLNAGSNVEDLTSIPEEQHEDTLKIKDPFHASDGLMANSLGFEEEHNEGHHFSLAENIYFDVPHSPPDFS